MAIDRSARGIDRRLRQASRLAEPLLAAQRAPDAVRRAIRQRVVDMSPEAIDRRLREVSELRDLCLELGSLTR